jgi:hypothetical protein
MAIKLVDKKTVINLNIENLGNLDLTSPSANPYPLYEGETLVIPSMDEQVLETEKTILKEDIKIEKIPYSQTSNNAGGSTFVIA